MLMLPFSLNTSSFPFPVCLFIDRITSTLQLCSAEKDKIFCSSLKSDSQIADHSHLLALHLFWVLLPFLEYGQKELYTMVLAKFSVTFYQAISLLFSDRNISPKTFLDLPSFTYVVRVSSFSTPHCSAGISHTEIPLPLLPLAHHMHNSVCTSRILGISCIYSQPDATCYLMWPERWDCSLGVRILCYRIFTFIFILTVISVLKDVLTLAGASCPLSCSIAPLLSRMGAEKIT